MSELQPDGTWGPATNVTELNTSGLDSTPSISHNGLEIFIGSNRAGGLGGTDIWVATRDTVGAPWSTPVNLGASVNTSDPEGHPDLSADRETLRFNSTRPGELGDLYVTTRSKERGHSGDE